MRMRMQQTFIISIGRSNISVLRYLFIAFMLIIMIRRPLLPLLVVLLRVLFLNIRLSMVCLRALPLQVPQSVWFVCS